MDSVMKTVTPQLAGGSSLSRAKEDSSGARMHRKPLRVQGAGFSERVVAVALSIPKGRVTTYGRIARACGAGPMASQSITGILGKAVGGGVPGIPFHRIVYADGRIWINERCRKERMKLYKKEGIEIDKNDRIKNFCRIVLDFK